MATGLDIPVPPGEPFGHYAVCPVRVIGSWAFESGQMAESALVFMLPPRIEQIAVDLRAAHPVEAPKEFQLRPHLTVLYLGVLEGLALGRLHRHLAPHLARMGAKARLAGFGLFETGRAHRCWHLKVAPTAPLAGLRTRLAESCGELGWQPVGLHYGKEFVPHITLWDLLAGEAPIVEAAALPPDTFPLSKLIHIGRPMSEPADG